MNGQNERFMNEQGMWS